MTLHSLFLLVALLEFQNNHIWKTVVGGFYIIYGLGYTLPAEQLDSERMEAQMIVLALNDKGTRRAAVYVLEV